MEIHSMSTGLPLLDQTDWSTLHHAYGRATDTPEHLRNLLSVDVTLRKAALSHLWSAILHQGTPWTATSTVALVIVGLLKDERIDQGELPVRTSLLVFLTGVASVFPDAPTSVEDLEQHASPDVIAMLATMSDEEFEYFFEDEEAQRKFFAYSFLGCHKIAPIIIESMLDGLTHTDPQTRAQAGMGAAILASSSLPERHDEIANKLNDAANSASDTDERSAHVLSLGILEVAPERFLSDSSTAVRLCAALSDNLAALDIATAILLDCLHRAELIDDWFTHRPPHFTQKPRFSVVSKLIARVGNFERLASAAEHIAGITSKSCVDAEWGQLLVAAFPEGNCVINTEAQRRYLRALTNNEDLWDPRYGNALQWFKKAGLPYDRQTCISLLKQRDAHER